MILFVLGRALLALLEQIGLNGEQLQVIHHVSTWYESAIFVSFAAFSCIEIWHAKYRELRRMGAAAR